METIPFVALRRPVSVPMPRLVVVAFVKSAVGKVFTAVVVAVKFAATTSPTTENLAYGDVVPTPTLLVLLVINSGVSIRAPASS